MTQVFRNNTVEPFFPAKGYTFAGYDDVSDIDTDADDYIWWYQAPISTNPTQAAEEVDGYIEKLRYVRFIRLSA